MTTPLLDLLRILGPRGREHLAELAETSVGSLYQLAGCHRANPSTRFAIRIEDATRVLADRLGTPIITMRELATMCPLRKENS